MFSKLMVSAAAAAFAAAPIAAQAAPERLPAALSEEADSLRGSPILLILAIAIALGLGLILLSDGDDPVSP